MAGTRQFKLRCSKCFNRDWRQCDMAGRTWENIEIIRRTDGGGAIAKCKTCGHEYRTYAKAASIY
jgi:ribosomal protein S27E